MKLIQFTVPSWITYGTLCIVIAAAWLFYESVYSAGVAGVAVLAACAAIGAVAGLIYAAISDYAHPNLAGNFAFFTIFEGDTARFDKPSDMTDVRNLIRATATLLSFVVERLTGVENELAAFTSHQT